MRPQCGPAICGFPKIGRWARINVKEDNAKFILDGLQLNEVNGLKSFTIVSAFIIH